VSDFEREIGHADDERYREDPKMLKEDSRVVAGFFSFDSFAICLYYLYIDALPTF